MVLASTMAAILTNPGRWARIVLVPSTADADTEPPEDLEDLDAAIGAIYGGALDEFVTARDRLARALRGAGRRDEAAAMRKLPKPKRLAWALDAAVLAEPAQFDAVDAAAEALADAQSGTDVREATNVLRAAARSLADAASERAAASGGAALDQSELVPAVLAVAADSDALAALRAGRLVDVPSAGAFGAFVPAPERAGPARARGERDAEAGTGTEAAPESKPGERARRPAGGRAPAREVKAAERAAAQAESGYEAARGRAEDAAAAAERAADELAAAEDRRRKAQREVEAARERLDDARRDARRAAVEADEAEDAMHDARASLARLE
jgi:hypothetical protein